MGWWQTAYERESIELFEVGDDIAELSVMRRDHVSGDLYELAFNSISRGALYFPSDEDAIEWANGVLADKASMHALFNYDL